MKPLLFLFAFSLATITNAQTNTFSIGDSVYHPVTQGIYRLQKSNYCYLKANASSEHNRIISVEIYLPGTISELSSGVYSLQLDFNTLTSGKASIKAYNICNCDFGGGYENIFYTSNSGEVSITIANGTIQAVFNEIEAMNNMNTLIKISGNILSE